MSAAVQQPVLQRARPADVSKARRQRGFTVMEMLVLGLICVVLLGILAPYLLFIRESSRRSACADNLRQLSNALRAYTKDNGGEFPRVVFDAAGRPDGYTAFTGADAAEPFAAGSPVRPNDVTASLWLLVRGGLVRDTRRFVCPSTGDARDLLLDASERQVAPALRGNFRRPNHLSYSYADPFSGAPGYRLNDAGPARFALMADRNPGLGAARHDWDEPQSQLSLANSKNHGQAGQNVLFADGSVSFEKTPYCGVGRSGGRPGDNIYTARAARPTTQAGRLPAGVHGLVGRDVAPVSNDDSYLVPTVEDRAGVP